MEVIKKETVYSGKFLRLVNKYFKGKDSKVQIWETVERTNTPEIAAAVIIAITKDNEIILERNWRVPSESYIIQLPAGLIDKKGESQEQTARRELLEETGYTGLEFLPVMIVPEDPVITPTMISHFLARDVEYVGKEEHDSAEQIEVLRVPLSKLADFLLNLPADTQLDLRVTGILWLLEKRGLLKL